MGKQVRKVRRATFSGQASIAVVGPFDTNDPQVADLADQIVAEGNTDIVLDLSETSYVTTQGIACIIKILKKAQAANGSLHIYGATEDVKSLFYTVKIDTYLNFV